MYVTHTLTPAMHGQAPPAGTMRALACESERNGAQMKCPGSALQRLLMRGACSVVIARFLKGLELHPAVNHNIPRAAIKHWVRVTAKHLARDGYQGLSCSQAEI